MVIRLSAIGDVAMVVPHLYAMCLANKDCEFTFLTQPFLSSLLINAPDNLEVLAFDKRNNKGFWSLLGFANRIRNEKFDTIIDLHDVLRTKVIRLWSSFASKTKVYKIDKHRGLRKKMLSGNKDILLPRMIDIYMNAISKADINDIGEVKPINICDYNFSEEIKKYTEIPHKIGIAPFASKRSKEVDLKIFDKIIDHISQNTSYKVLLFCSKDELTRAEHIIDKYKNCVIPVRGQLGLSKELVIMSGLSCMVSMDSANMHLASMVGTPVVSLWAGTSTRCGFLGIGQKETDTVSSPICCSPCSIFGTDKCRLSSFECTKNIDIDKIIDRINFYIDNNYNRFKD